MHEGHRAEALIDDELWAPLEDAIRAAKRSIVLTQLFFEPTFRARSVPLCDHLEAAAKRGVRVRILVNENAAIPDSYDELSHRFEGTDVEVRALRMTPNVMHLKVFLVDDELLFLVDAPFEQKYCDTTAHHRDSKRRERKKPLHSVSLRLQGPEVATASAIFGSLWRAAHDEEPSPIPTARAEGLRLAWSAPAGLLDGPRHDILAAYEAAIARAKDYVYVENQYFTSPRIAQALLEAVRREPALEVILLLNVSMDVPTYDTWQARRLEELRAASQNIEAFALWSPYRGPGVSVRQVYIHSKVALVDDAWATVGSANLDSISLHDAEEFVVPAPPNVELNAIVPHADWATALRRRLWAHHLDDEGAWGGARPRLADWRRIAERNLERYLAQDSTRVGRLFPFDALAKEWRKPLSRRGAGLH